MNGDNKKTVIKLSRRSLMAAAVLAGASTFSRPTEALAQTAPVPSKVEEKRYSCACRNNCQSLCRLYAYVRNGRLVKTSMAPLGSDDGRPQDPRNSIYNTVCLRGLSNAQRIYGTNRVLYPLKQTKKRGDVSGFQRISWEQAIKEITAKIAGYNRTPAGMKSVAVMSSSGNYATVNGITGAVGVFRNILKANTLPTGLDMALCVGLSTVLGIRSYPFLTGNELRDITNAKTLFLWGSNTSEAHLMSWGVVADAMRKGTKVIDIDVMLTPTASKADMFINIKSGTDAMLLLSMMYVLFYEKPAWLDIVFLCENTTAPMLVRADNKMYLRAKDLPGNKPDDNAYVAYNTKTKSLETTSWKAYPQSRGHTGGNKAMLTGGTAYELEAARNITVNKFDEKGNITGTEQIQAAPAFSLLKQHVRRYTPAYTETYTGIAPNVTRRLTELYAAPENKPASIYCGFGLSQYYNAHHTGQAIATIAALTGNCMKTGASVGNFFRRSMSVPGLPRPAVTLPSLPIVHMRNALEKENHPLRMIYMMCANPVNNYVNQKQDWLNYIVPKMECIVVQDIELTDSARNADYVLPAAHWFEVEDLHSASKNPFIQLQEKVIEPQGESMADVEILQRMTEALDKLIPGLDGSKWFMKDGRPKTGKEYISECINPNAEPELNINAERLFKEKVIRNIEIDNTFVFGGDGYVTTDSGRLEFYTEMPERYCRVVSYGQTLGEAEKDLERMPSWEEPDEAYFGPTTRKNFEELRKKYPLHLLTEHTRWRVHSQYAHIPWLREQDPEPTVKINPADAKRYGNIGNGDYVRVSNDRGSCVAKAILTEGLPEGIVNMPKGWYIEHYTKEYGYGGNYQELSNPVYHKVGMSQCFYDVRVKIEKA